MLTRFKHEVEQTRTELLGHSPCGVELMAILDMNGCALAISNEHASVLGYEPNDLQGRSPFPYIHPEDVENVRQSFEEMVRTNQPVHAHYRFIHNTNGRWVHLHGIGAPLLRDGVVLGFLVVSREKLSERLNKIDVERIIDWMEFNSQVKEYQQKFYRCGVQLVGIVDMNGITRYVSESHIDIVGWTPRELIGRNNMEKIHPDDLENVVEQLRSMLNTDSPKGVKYRYRHKDGSWVEGVSFAAPLMKEGIMHGVIIVSHPSICFDLSALMDELNVDCIIRTLGLKPNREPGI